MWYVKQTATNERGDTIVEVLIAIAVVSMVLGGAYVTTNRSLQASRSAQEQGVAIKLVEGQLEGLKALADQPGGLATAPATFCILSSGGKPAPVSVSGPGNPCSLNNQGVTASATDQPAYKIAITELTTDNFQITANWYDVSGNQNDGIQMNYRVYPQ